LEGGFGFGAGVEVTRAPLPETMQRCMLLRSRVVKT